MGEPFAGAARGQREGLVWGDKNRTVPETYRRVPHENGTEGKAVCLWASRAEILALLQQLNTLVDSDTVGTLIAQINNAVKKSGDTMTGDLNMGGHAIIGAELTQIVQATLTAAGWSASAPYTQTVAVAGVTAGSPPYITPVYSGVVDADIALREACAAVSYAKPGAGTVTFVCLENKPETNIQVQVEVKR